MIKFSFLLISLTWLAQPHFPAEAQKDHSLWEKIQVMDQWIQKEMEHKVEGIEIRNLDPVRAYYLDPSRIVVIIPVHHIRQNHPMKVFSGAEPSSNEMTLPVQVPDLKNQEKRNRQFRESYKRDLALKEANLEKFLTEIKPLFLAIKERFKEQSNGLEVHLVVEERDRVWMASPLKGKTQYERHLVTLSVDDLGQFRGEADQIRDSRYTRKLKAPHQPTDF